MTISKTFFDQTRLVPETDETGWGSEVTSQLCDLLDGADEILFRDSSNNVQMRLQAASSTLAAGATLTQTSPVHKVQGTPGAVTLAGITAGEKDGQVLVLIGQHAVNTVSLTYSATLLLNGNITLGLGDIVRLVYDLPGTRWIELFRNN